LGRASNRPALFLHGAPPHTPTFAQSASVGRRSLGGGWPAPRSRGPCAPLRFVAGAHLRAVEDEHARQDIDPTVRIFRDAGGVFGHSQWSPRHSQWSPGHSQWSLAMVPEPFAMVPEPFAMVPELFAKVPEPFAIVPEPFAIVPEPFAMVPEPLQSRPTHKNPDTPRRVRATLFRLSTKTRKERENTKKASRAPLVRRRDRRAQ
jgi:hypothetical protein